ncbi:STAS/SEC14 domain-containing protein [Flammeovirga sp. EKP202]|uniref:STAS/SEC14 domain-containing protein n=1 Tax=Flammeovirga sp. EKP202 TaxID=2770592 RepID=UPI00165FFAC5|nr:STAS/SEC14 domain-containing protein [Flammeovirga sp. EKP202]MBD0404562.1 STAS/SEC14 domain-containing protein [Flammeovirga sp. EKP202]
MIKINSTLGSNVIGFTINGKIDEEGLQEFFKAIEEKTNENGKIKLLGEIEAIGGVEDFKAFIDLLKTKAKTIKALEKYAFVSDTEWMQKISGIVDFMIPNIPIKMFKTEERDEALVWLLQKEEAFVPGIHKIEVEDNDNFLAYRFTGKINPQEYVGLDSEFSSQINAGKPLNLYMEFAGFEGYSNILAMWDDFKTGIKYYSDIKKVAIVNSGEWMDFLVKIGDIFTPGINMEHFEVADKERAKTWLNR